MSLRDRFSHGAEVAKWKVGQQKRLLKIQGQIGDIEKNISKHKTNLLEMVFDLHARGILDNQDLVQICEDILTLEKHISGKEEEAVKIRREKPPEKHYSTSETSKPKRGTEEEE